MRRRALAVIGLLCAAAVRAATMPSGPAADAILPAEQAFALLPAERDGHRLVLQWAIAPGYFLYRARIHASTPDPGAPALPALVLPHGIVERDPEGGNVEIFRTQARATLDLDPRHPAPHRLRVTFQGCADIGICYPPQTQTVAVPP